MSRKNLESTPSKSSCEADFFNYDDFNVVDPKILPAHKTGYYYQDYPYVKPTQSAFDRKEVKGSKLFDKRKEVKIQDSFVKDEEPRRDASILVSGFGMRNVESFQRLMKMSQEERRKWELRKLWRDEQRKLSIERQELADAAALKSARTESTEASTSTESKSKISTDFLSQTETTPRTQKDRKDMRHLDYLLGLEAQVEEEPEPFLEMEVTEVEDEYKYSGCKAIRDAQRYLRTHKIFECFQFIVAHLLSAKAENPVEFILNLLNRCLLYRSGLGAPPLLYENQHITKLFDMMDRMQTGFIDMAQYTTGMKTLGICSYSEDPEVNDEGMVAKAVFVEETYEAELALFDDMIKRRVEKTKMKMKKSSFQSDSGSVPSLNPPYFIPSDLFKSDKKKEDPVSTEGE